MTDSQATGGAGLPWPGSRAPRETLHHLTQRAYAIVLAGGRGSRLHELTDWRAKPAVPFAGKLKIIDFALSNCVNSGIRRIGVLTQYKAQSLIRHVERGWGFLEASLGEYVDVVPAQQRQGDNWYSGTANAVYQNLDILREANPEFVLVLAGDHIYKMDYARMLDEHVARGADLTLACIEVPLREACNFGVVSVDADARVTAFEEKPAHPIPCPDVPGRALASMGIYVFNMAFLGEHLARDAAEVASSHDFGKDMLPALVRGHRVFAHHFADSCVNIVEGRPYWRDVGTVDAYWEANLDLTAVVPELNLYDPSWPIMSLQKQLPPAKFVFDDEGRRGMAVNSLVTSGCIVSGATVRRSVLFSNVRVGENSVLEDAVILPNVVVGRGVILRRVVVDKHCMLPDGFKAGVHPAEDRARFHVTERGVTLITPKMLGQAYPAEWHGVRSA
ncbi:MAG: glucose-1-phosphate adenylyltransferase [Burkholderiales bacterium]|nr:glucose-1-phosphate adenylyltransferase [Burkholderiales bacterium]